MIAIISVANLEGLLEKLKMKINIEPEVERIPTLSHDGRVIVSHHYHFRWCLADIYVGIPEDSCLIVGSENEIRNLLLYLGIPVNAFTQAMAVK